MVYLSSLVEPRSHEVLEGILAQARDNNREAAITGLLVCHQGNCLQVLEGPRDAVLDCFGRIENDARHRGCVVLTSEPVAQREFEDWDMAFVPFDDLHPDNRQNFIDLHDLRHSGKLEGMKGDKKLEILVGTFLGGFRDLAFL
ncbi:MAG: BLUF domain-containing protein [Parvibaculaceae bacterium]